MAHPRIIPSIEQLRQRPGIAALEQQHGHEQTIAALREAADGLRESLRSSGDAPGFPADADGAASLIESRVAASLSALSRGSLIPVINATGVIVHTNLGRAPLAASALQRVAQVGRGYANLEYDLAEGQRGSRHVHAEALLTRLTGAEAAIVVNNNAAATMLVLQRAGHRT